LGDASAFSSRAISAKASGPRDRLVAVRAGPSHHRLRQAALLVHPQIAPLQQIRDRVLREERRRDALRRIASLATALTPFSQNSAGLAVVVRIGPGAARTIEAVLLVQLEQRPQAALDAHVAHARGGRSPRSTSRPAALRSRLPLLDG
jgi:hypothetical protein